MERMTQKDGETYFSETDREALVQRLGKFEDVYEHLLRQQEKTEADMEELRRQGRQKSVTFRQLMAQKLGNGNLLALLKLYGL